MCLLSCKIDLKQYVKCSVTEQLPKMYPKFDHRRFCLTDKSAGLTKSAAKKEVLRLLLHASLLETIFSEKGSLDAKDSL